MPAVPITSSKQFARVIGVLTEVGGTWQGVGGEDRYLLVTQKQYETLLKADLVPEKLNGDSARAKKSPKKR